MNALSAPKASVIILLGSRYEDMQTIVEELRRVLAPLVAAYEVVIVDDCTGPDTQRLVQGVRQRFAEVRVIRLQRHMEEAVALAIGVQSAREEILITLDPYLHVSLDDLPKLITPVLEGGMDLVCAWRTPRQERGLSRLASEAFNAAARWLTQVPVHDLNCRTRVMRRAVVQDIPLYGDLHRFLPIFVSRRGYKWCEIPVPQQPGKKEMGAFDAKSYIGRFLDLLTLLFLTRFVRRPLHFFGLIGALSFAVGVLISLYLVCYKFIFDAAIGHRPLLLLGVLLIVVGVQVASIGLLGELFIFTHARDLKDYVVQDDLA